MYFKISTRRDCKWFYDKEMWNVRGDGYVTQIWSVYTTYMYQNTSVPHKYVQLCVNKSPIKKRKENRITVFSKVQTLGQGHYHHLGAC